MIETTFKDVNMRIVIFSNLDWKTVKIDCRFDHLNQISLLLAINMEDVVYCHGVVVPYSAAVPLMVKYIDPNFEDDENGDGLWDAFFSLAPAVCANETVSKIQFHILPHTISEYVTTEPILVIGIIVRTTNGPVNVSDIKEKFETYFDPNDITEEVYKGYLPCQCLCSDCYRDFD